MLDGKHRTETLPRQRDVGPNLRIPAPINQSETLANER